MDILRTFTYKLGNLTYKLRTIFLLLLLSAAGTGNVWADDDETTTEGTTDATSTVIETVGSEDLTTAFAGAFSQRYALVANGTYHFEFVNKGDGAQYFDNWVLVFDNSNNTQSGGNILTLRADNFGWNPNGYIYSDAFTTVVDLTNFNTIMKNATVSMDVIRSGNTITMVAKTTPSDATYDPFTYSYTGTISDVENLCCYFTVEKAYLEITKAEFTLDAKDEVYKKPGTTFTQLMINETGVTYSSSDTNVATVDASTGAVTTVAAGNATITATNASGDTKSYIVKVRTPKTETYDFENFVPAKTANEITLLSQSYEQSGTNTRTVYLMDNPSLNNVTLELNKRFAASNFVKGVNINKWMWRASNGKISRAGLSAQYNASSTATTLFNLSILDLYEGDEVTIVYSTTNTSAQIYPCDATAIVETLANSYLVSGTTYTMTRDGQLDLYDQSNNMSIHSISIATCHYDDFVDDPVITVTASGADRVVKIKAESATFMGNNVKTYYTTDGTEPTKETFEYIYGDEGFTQSADKMGNVTVNAITISDDGSVKSNIVSITFEIGTEVQLNAPTIEVTDYSNDNYTVKFTSDQSNLVGSPNAILCYTIGDDAEKEYNGDETVTVPSGSSVTVYATTGNNDDYKNSEPVYREFNSREFDNVWTQDYTNIVSGTTDACAVVLSSSVDFTVNGKEFYNIKSYTGGSSTYDVSLNDNVGLSDARGFWLRVNGNNSGILQNTVNTGYLGIRNLEVGQSIVITASSNFLTPEYGVEVDETRSSPTELYYIATAESASWSVTKDIYNYIKSISVLRPYTPEYEAGDVADGGVQYILTTRTPGATIMYSLDGEEEQTYNAETGVSVISSNSTLTAYAELNGIKSEILTIEDVYAVATQLYAPTFSTSYYDATNNTATVTLTAATQTNVAGTPVVSIYYKVNEGEEQAYTEAFTANVGDVITAIARADGYSDATKEYTVLAELPLVKVWDIDFTQYTSVSYGTLSGSSSISKLSLYQLIDDATGEQVNENLLVNGNGDDPENHFYIYNGGLYLQSGGNRDIKLSNIKEGQYIRLTGKYYTDNAGSAVIQGFTNSTLYSSSEVDGETVALYYVNTTGDVTISLHRYTRLLSLEVLTPAPPTLTVTAPEEKTKRTLTITSSFPNATIQYRIDGGTWRDYNTPVTLEQTDEHQSYTVDYRLVVGTVQYDMLTYLCDFSDLSVTAPTATITGVYYKQRTVTLSDEQNNVTIYYNTDGGEDYIQYTDPFTISESTTIYMYAQDAVGYQSDIVTAELDAGSSVTLNGVTTYRTAYTSEKKSVYDITTDQSSVQPVAPASYKVYYATEPYNTSTSDDDDATYTLPLGATELTVDENGKCNVKLSIGSYYFFVTADGYVMSQTMLQVSDADQATLVKGALSITGYKLVQGVDFTRGTVENATTKVNSSLLDVALEYETPASNYVRNRPWAGQSNTTFVHTTTVGLTNFFVQNGDNNVSELNGYYNSALTNFAFVIDNIKQNSIVAVEMNDADALWLYSGDGTEISANLADNGITDVNGSVRRTRYFKMSRNGRLHFYMGTKNAIKAFQIYDVDNTMKYYTLNNAYDFILTQDLTQNEFFDVTPSNTSTGVTYMGGIANLNTRAVATLTSKSELQAGQVIAIAGNAVLSSTFAVDNATEVTPTLRYESKDLSDRTPESNGYRYFKMTADGTVSITLPVTINSASGSQNSSINALSVWTEIPYAADLDLALTQCATLTPKCADETVRTKLVSSLSTQTTKATDYLFNKDNANIATSYPVIKAAYKFFNYVDQAQWETENCEKLSTGTESYKTTLQAQTPTWATLLGTFTSVSSLDYSSYNGYRLNFHNSYEPMTAEDATDSAYFDITYLMYDPEVTDISKWNRSNMKDDAWGYYTNEQYDAAPDNYFLDIYNGASDESTYAAIYTEMKLNGSFAIATDATNGTLRQGIYTVQAATRGQENTSNAANIFVSFMNSEDNTETYNYYTETAHVGNTGGDLGNGWSWREVCKTAIPTGYSPVCIGFGAKNGGWASADDFRLLYYKFDDNSLKARWESNRNLGQTALALETYKYPFTYGEEYVTLRENVAYEAKEPKEYMHYSAAIQSSITETANAYTSFATFEVEYGTANTELNKNVNVAGQVYTNLNDDITKYKNSVMETQTENSFDKTTTDGGYTALVDKLGKFLEYVDVCNALAAEVQYVNSAVQTLPAYTEGDYQSNYTSIANLVDRTKNTTGTETTADIEAKVSELRTLEKTFTTEVYTNDGTEYAGAYGNTIKLPVGSYAVQVSNVEDGDRVFTFEVADDKTTEVANTDIKLADVTVTLKDIKGMDNDWSAHTDFTFRSMGEALQKADYSQRIHKVLREAAYNILSLDSLTDLTNRYGQNYFQCHNEQYVTDIENVVETIMSNYRDGNYAEAYKYISLDNLITYFNTLQQGNGVADARLTLPVAGRRYAFTHYASYENSTDHQNLYVQALQGTPAAALSNLSTLQLVYLKDIDNTCKYSNLVRIQNTDGRYLCASGNKTTANTLVTRQLTNTLGITTWEVVNVFPTGTSDKKNDKSQLFLLRCKNANGDTVYLTTTTDNGTTTVSNGTTVGDYLALTEYSVGDYCVESDNLAVWKMETCAVDITTNKSTVEHSPAMNDVSAVNYTYVSPAFEGYAEDLTEVENYINDKTCAVDLTNLDGLQGDALNIGERSNFLVFCQKDAVKQITSSKQTYNEGENIAEYEDGTYHCQKLVIDDSQYNKQYNTLGLRPIYDFIAVNGVTHTRTVGGSAGSYQRWSTLILPYQVRTGLKSIDGKQVMEQYYTFNKVTSSNGVMTVIFEETDVLAANTPGAVRRGETDDDVKDIPTLDIGSQSYNVNISKKTELASIQGTDDNWTMYGTYAYKKVVKANTSGYIYAIYSDDTFRQYTSACNVAPYRCYFIGKDITTSQSASSSAKALAIGTMPSTTDIALPSSGNDRALSIFLGQGTITLEANNDVLVRIYDISGNLVYTGTVGYGSSQTVNVPTGVYIVNGTKVYVK